MSAPAANVHTPRPPAAPPQSPVSCEDNRRRDFGGNTLPRAGPGFAAGGPWPARASRCRKTQPAAHLVRLRTAGCVTRIHCTMSRWARCLTSTDSPSAKA